MKISNILGYAFIAFIILSYIIGTAVQFATHNLLGIIAFTFVWGMAAGVLLRELMIRLDAKPKAIVPARSH